MTNTDFFDDDLAKKDGGAKTLRSATPTEQPNARGGVMGGPDRIPARSVSDLNLSRMAQHKKDVHEGVAKAVEELERLKNRQTDLEREKHALEDLREKETSFEQGKKEMVDRFRQSLVTLEKEELRSASYTDLLASTRKRFKTMLTEVEELNDEMWPEGHIREELNNALAVIDNSRMEYNKSLAKIDSVKGDEPKAGSDRQPVIFDNPPAAREFNQPFGFWVKVGVAVTLPLIATLVILATLFLYLQSNGLI